MKSIVILISGTGSNMAAIVQAEHQHAWRQRLGAQVAAVISNRPDAAGLQWARAQQIPTAVVDHTAFESRALFDDALAKAVHEFTPTLVVLAGFMRVLTPGFVRQFEHRLINIHPSLLPAFTGLHTARRALDAGCRVAGATVHWVTDELDSGLIIDQAVVPILPGDDVTTLTRRVQAQEHLLYPRAIESLLPQLQKP